MTRSERSALAACFALAHWVVAVLIQSGDYYGYLYSAASGIEPAALFLFTLPFLQAQNLLISAALAGIVWIVAARRGGAWVAWVLFVMLAAYQLLDQVFYKIFFSHIRRSMVGGGAAGFNLTITMSSFTQELDRLFWFDAIAILATTVLLARWIIHPPLRAQSVWKRADLLGVLLLAGMPSLVSEKYFHLNEHPLIALVSDAASKSLRDVVHAPASAAAQNFGAVTDVAPELAAWTRKMRARDKPLNVILIELESVGSVQLLDPSGLPREWATPNIARLARHSIIFQNVYTVFPGTTRTIVFLHTGGRTITWGGEFEFGYQYQGPLMAPIFHSLGYDTALYSAIRLDGEGSDLFLSRAGFGEDYDFSRDLPHHHPQFMVNSWGAREEMVAAMAESWIDDTVARKKPFFLKFMTTATHHPYGVPPGYVGPLKGDDRKTHYINALHYSDSVIGQIMNFLDQRGLRDDTLIAIIGDHGQAFGEQHAWNFTHKNELYEENIRSFLLLSNPSLGGARISKRVGWISDVMPTLVDIAGAQPPDVPGRSLTAESFPPRTVFFHKTATPEKWGLRDGPWKFVQEIRTGAGSELYDLSTDPEEKINVVKQHEDRIPVYRAELEKWFLDLNRDFTSRLKDYPKTGTADPPETVETPGPKLIAMGTRPLPRRVFLEGNTFGPNDGPQVWVKWVGDSGMRVLRFEWTAPNGKQYSNTATPDPNWVDLFYPLPVPPPLAAGVWKVQMFWNGKPALTTSFTISGESRSPRR